MGRDTAVVAPQTPGVIAGRLFIYGILVLFAAYFLVPLIVMIFTSVKTMEDIRTGSLISLPKEVTFDAWAAAWNSASTAPAGKTSRYRIAMAPNMKGVKKIDPIPHANALRTAITPQITMAQTIPPRFTQTARQLVFTAGTAFMSLSTISG